MPSESVLGRVDRLLGRITDQSTTSRFAASGSGATDAAGELEELFAFWAACDAAPPREPALNAPVIALSAMFVCALSAGAISMVTPYRPSVSEITDFFATSIPGYDQEQGIPVLERSPVGFENNFIRAGGFDIRPTLESGLSYDDNVLGAKGSPSSVVSHVSPTLTVNSDWARNALGLYLSADNAEYLDTPRQSRTDWNAALGGSYTIGRGNLTVAYSHLSLHEDSTYLNAVPTSTPLAFTVEDLRANYTIQLGALTLTPNLDYSIWQFGTATLGGQTVDEKFQNHEVLQAGLAAAYATSGRASLLATSSVIAAHYPFAQPGAPAPSAVSGLMMAGIDYRFSGALRMRVLLGAEVRAFDSDAYRSRIAPIGQANIIWTPTGLTTVTATIARTLEDAVQADTGGYTYTKAELEVDHELLRNVVLQSHLGVQDAQSLQGGGSQTTVYGGLGATWRLNRDLSLTFSYQYTAQSALAAGNQAVSPAALSLGAFSRNVVDVRLRAAL